MPRRFLAWSAALALLALTVTEVDACGRRGRRGCGGAASYGGDCGSCGGGYGFAAGYANYGLGGYPIGWGGQAFAPASFGPTIMPPGLAPTFMPAPGATSGVQRSNAVYAIDPASGVLRQVGWLGADGRLHALHEAQTQPASQPARELPGVPPAK